MADVSENQCFPELQGTPKQIAWATDIRSKKLAAVQEKLQLLHQFGQAKEQIEQVLLKHSSAKWWIENREMFFDGFIAYAAKELQLIGSEAFRSQDKNQITTSRYGENREILEQSKSTEIYETLILGLRPKGFTYETAPRFLVVEEWDGNRLARVWATVKPSDLPKTETGSVVTTPITKFLPDGWASQKIEFIAIKFYVEYQREPKCETIVKA